MQNKSETALGFGFIVVVCFIFSTCSYDIGKKHGRKEVFLDEVSCIQHFDEVYCKELNKPRKTIILEAPQ